MKQLVCLADTPWSGAPTRTQQLMARLKQVQILYFEPPARRRGKPWKQPGRRVRPGLVVYALPPVLDEEENSRLIFRAGQRKLERYVEKVLLRHRVQDPVLWCASPSAVHLLDAVPSRGIVYDCGRDWSHLPDQWESELALAADVVFAASPELADHIGPVSYTHLDVYKRQSHWQSVMTPVVNSKCAVLRLWAVSYTHLDVYKRQPRICPRRQNTGEGRRTRRARAAWRPRCV